MDGSTKILTVSYGTFSCTLEGFDDPLGAMRDIAEYFRDLAADDRYFGAEPPTPDVEMLQSIAEKEVNRRVEARMSETGIALRQVDKAPEPVEVTPEPEVEAKPLEDAGAIAARVVSAARASDDDDATEADTPDTGTGPLTFDDEFLMADEPEDVLAVDPSARVTSGTPAESVAEKLRRIRAVVSRNIDAKAENATSTDNANDAERRDRALTETIEQITADISDEDDEELAEDVAAEADEADAQASDTDDEADTQPSDADQVDASDDAASGDDGFEDKADEDSNRIDSAARDTSEALWVRDAEVEEAASEGDLLGDDLGLDDEDEDDTEDSLFAEDGADAAEDDNDGPSDQENDDTIERRISDIIGNVAERIDQDEYDEDDTPEDEGAVEDLVADADDKAGEDNSALDTEAAKHGLNKPLSDDQDRDVGRILAETDNKLNEDDVVRRRRVISQMRAAVAATKADRLVSRQVPRETVEEEERSPYRNDLSEVVRAATTVPHDGGRPKTASPPLVLVSSQRVDAANEDEEAEADDLPEDFADFAETMGAKELPELLEAAAAYTVFGEGHPSFTRPEIMKRVAAVDPTIRMSREESLRSFGQLLRQGKFRKLERGQFTIDQDTKFNPKHRIAG